MRNFQRIAQHVLLTCGVVLLGYCAFVLIQAKLFQSNEERNFATMLRVPPPSGPAPALPAPRGGQVVGQLEIPRLGFSVMVVEGDDAGDLKRAAGHIPGTAFPGHPGNTGIAAHRDTYFRPLRLIHQGDAVTLNTLDGTYRYRVVSTKVVQPDDNQVLRPTPRDTLTLVTCYPFYYIGPAPKRFIVRAERLPNLAADARR